MRLPADLSARTPHAAACRGRLEKKSSALPPTLAGAGATRTITAVAEVSAGVVAHFSMRPCGHDRGVTLVPWAHRSWWAHAMRFHAMKASLSVLFVSYPASGVCGCWGTRVVTLEAEGAHCIARSDASI